jgi:hypothetical protein
LRRKSYFALTFTTIEWFDIGELEMSILHSREADLSRRKFIREITAIGTLTATGFGTVRGFAAAESSRATPRVTGPIKGGQHGSAFGAYFGDIARRGYVEEEYFIEGTAGNFDFAGDFAPDGRWTMVKSGSVPYKTRLLVRRPRDAKRFNGTVVVEWTNVSNGYDVSFADPPGLYEGFGYVAVSAQRVGVHGFDVDPRGTGKPAQGLLQWDPKRYGGLSIPGDSFSYDIFTQAARAIRAGRVAGGVDPMGGLKVRKLVAIGGSQSGSRLVSYINGVQPIEQAFDALIPLVFGGASAPWVDGLPNDPRIKSGPKQSGFTKIRDDLAAPVFAMNSETEAPYYVVSRQPDTDRFRYWEVAGASHGGTGQIALIRQKTERDGIGGPGGGHVHVSDVMWLPTADAAIHHVHHWINGGLPPPHQTYMLITGSPPTVQRDAHGNALGGVRLPEVEVPIARYAASTAASQLLGETFPFSPDELKQLYPTHEDYVSKVTAAANAALRTGIILPYRVEQYIEEAKAAAVPA